MQLISLPSLGPAIYSKTFRLVSVTDTTMQPKLPPDFRLACRHSSRICLPLVTMQVSEVQGHPRKCLCKHRREVKLQNRPLPNLGAWRRWVVITTLYARLPAGTNRCPVYCRLDGFRGQSGRQEKSHHHGNSIPGRPARSESLYRLSCRNCRKLSELSKMLFSRQSEFRKM